MDFSIIVPTYNRQKLLKRCIKALKEQKYNGTYEIIIINDGSSDNTKNFLSKENIVTKTIQHSGQAIARNTGLALAKGNYVAFTDDDCIVPKDWLTRLQRAFIEHGADAVGGAVLNPTNRYIAWSQYILNFSEWFATGKSLIKNDIPTANNAYKINSIKGLKFRTDFNSWGYTDSLFNHELRKRDGMIVFVPSIKVKHYTWSQDYGLSKFYSIQKKCAVGFNKGGYKVHGRLGRILIKYRIVNLLCPRLMLVVSRCLRAGMLAKFAYHAPLIIAGEFYRNLIIFQDVR